MKKSRYGYSLCCERGTSENFCPWALAPDTKFSLILLPSFTGRLLSHKCHPLSLKRNRKQGSLPFTDTTGLTTYVHNPLARVLPDGHA